jgi:hydrogenase maturation protease
VRSGETLVIGIGQPLGGDDAVGLAVAERLRTEGIQTRTVTDGAELATALAGAERAVIIDAVAGGGPAGSVLHLQGDELCGLAGAVPVSSHGLSVADAVALARALGGASEAHLIGVAIEPRDVRQSPPRAWEATSPGAGASLSAEVAAAVETAAARVRALLQDGETAGAVEDG